MSLQVEIESAFPKTLNAPIVSNDFILNNQNIMELEENIDLFKYVPSYMIWTIKNSDEYEELVDGYTINTLAEYGKTKSIDNPYLNFMHLCNKKQKLAVIKFLKWCSRELSLVDENQIERALRNWSIAIVPANKTLQSDP